MCVAAGARRRSLTGVCLLAVPMEVHLKPGKDRPVRFGHPWIFSGPSATSTPRPSQACWCGCDRRKASCWGLGISIRAAPLRCGCSPGRRAD